MIVDYTPEARADLEDIWDWNAKRYGREHADSYVAFLQLKTDLLFSQHARGRPVPINPNFRYRVIQKRTKRHGHIVVYEVIDNAIVRIVRFIHTAQNWQVELKQGFDED
jgi:plasmid stabilization system protein ParE